MSPETPWTRPRSDVEHLAVIRQTSVELLRNRRRNGLSPDAVIILASLVFVDNEGVAVLHAGSLARWCLSKGHSREEQDRLVQEQIDRLVTLGALAPGSTSTELLSMIAHRAGNETTEESR